MDALKDPEILERLQPKEYYRKWMENYFPVRPDQRTTDQFRELAVQTGTIGTADSSATVRLGATAVVTGIKLEVAEPALAAPEEGFLVFNLTLSAGCSPSIRAGPPTDRAQLLSEKIAMLLKKTGVLPKSALVIVPGKLVWTLYIDALVLNDAGNVYDAAWISTIAALRELRLPSVRTEEDTGIVVADASRTEPLALHCIPLPASFVYLAEKDCTIADPTDREEAVMEGEEALLLVDSHDTNILLHSSSSFSSISTSTSTSTSPSLFPSVLLAAGKQDGVQRHFTNLKSTLQI